jgi:sulfate transport system substrate-binding protein
VRRRALFSLLLTAGLFIPACTQKQEPTAQTSQSGAQTSKTVELTLVGYGVAKPLYSKIIPEFQKEWKAKTGQEVKFKESYGPSGAQSRAILGGLEADVLAQNLQSNIDSLVAKNFVDKTWNQRLPNQASPASTVMVLVTRPENPKQIKDWSDLTRKDVSIVAINPQTSGNARWGILAGYGSFLKSQGDKPAQDYLYGVTKNIKTLVSSGREATDTFVKNKIGDVMVNFENEIIFTNGVIPENYPYVVPSTNIQVDFPVTVIDKVVDKKGTRKVAEAFTQFLFTPKAQEIYAQLGYRPIDKQVYSKYTKQYQPVTTLYTIADFGGWQQVDQKLFADGALFDRAQSARAK